MALGIRNILLSGGTYLSFSVLNRAMPFLLLPLLTRYISPEGYGTITVVALVTSIGMPIIGLCSNTVLNQRYFRLSKQERALFLNDCYKVISGNTLLVLFLSVPFAASILSYLKISTSWFQVGVLCAAAGMVATLTTTLMQLRKQPVRYGVFQLVSSILNVGLTLVLVVLVEMSWEGRVLSIFLAYMITACLAVVLNILNDDVNIAQLSTSTHIKEIVRLGSILVPSTISGWVIVMSDRMFLTSMTTLEVVGIYAVGVMVAQITDIVLAALSRACQPYFFEFGASTDQQQKVRIVQGMYLYMLISLLTALMVTISAPLIMTVMVDERFHSGVLVIGWMSLSYAFYNIGTAFMNLLLVVDKNSITTYVSFIVFLLSLIGNYFLISAFGMVGAAMASTISAFVFMILLAISSNRYNKLPWFDKTVFIPGI